MKKTINKIEQLGIEAIDWMCKSEWRAASVIILLGALMIFILTFTY